MFSFEGAVPSGIAAGALPISSALADACGNLALLPTSCAASHRASSPLPLQGYRGSQN